MYALAGVVIFFIMRALGELLMYRPVSGSFAEYAREFLGPFFGFVTGWTYWLHVGRHRHGRTDRRRHLHPLLVPGRSRNGSAPWSSW